MLSKLQEQEPTSETSRPSTSRIDAVEQQLSKLTKAVSDLSGFVKVMDEVQTNKLVQLSTSQQRELPSTLPLDAETKNRLAEVEKTLQAIASQLSSSEVVRLPDGSSVTRSEIDAHAMMSALREQMKVVTSATERNTEAVTEKSRVKLDAEKVAATMTSRVGAEIDKLVGASTERVDQVLTAHETRLESLGRLQEVRVVSRLQEATKGLERAERMAEGLRRSLTLAGVGKVAMALIPFAIVGLVLASLLGLGGQLLGIGPVFAWAWSLFAAAETWWLKLIIATSTIGGALGVLWVIKMLGQKLYETYRGW